MRAWIPAILCGIPLWVMAQTEMEIIPLRHRTGEQVVPALQGLLEPGGTLSAFDKQLIIKTSRRNLEQLRQALSVMDRPLRRLRIRVSQSREVESHQQSTQVSGDVSFGRNVRIIAPQAMPPETSRIEIRQGAAVLRASGSEVQHSGEQLSTQSVQVLEGGRAMIRVGRSIPLLFRQLAYGPQGRVVTTSQVYHDVGQGFVAVPQLVGERVSMEISPVFDTLVAGGGQLETQRLSTTVSGRLGEWIELGGSQQQSEAQVRMLSGKEGQRSMDQRSIWLLVEELP